MPSRAVFASLLLLFAVGCAGTAAGPTAKAPIRSGDGATEITMPAGWRPLQGLNASATIEAGNPSADEYVIVLSDRREDFSRELSTLEAYAELTRGYQVSGLEKPSVSTPRRIEVAGFPAVQSEIFGVVNGLRLAFVHTALETPTSYHQILTWTRASRMNRARANFDELLASFRELSPLGPRPSFLTTLKGGRILDDEDGVTLRVPADWTDEIDLNDLAVLEAGHPTAHLYVIVRAEPREDFDEDLDLEGFFRLMSESQATLLEEVEETAPVPLKVGGHDALRGVMHGTRSHLLLSFVLTAVATPDTFAHVTAWTLTSRYREAAPLLVAISDSLGLED